MLHDVLLSASRLPLLFRGDAMRPSSLAALAVVAPLVMLYLAFKMRSGMRANIACAWAFLVMYAAWAAGLLFEPSARAADPYLVDGASHWINFVPFATIVAQVEGASGSALVQLVGNIGLLMPLGLIGPIVMPSLQRAPRLVLAALGGSVAIELVQLLGTNIRLLERSVDVDDVILNVTGAVLGWLLWRVAISARRRVSRSLVPDESTS